MYLTKIDSIVQQELSETLNIDRTTTMKIVLNLEDLGIVRRVRDPKDSRAYIISLTTKGIKVAKIANEIIDRVESKFLATLTKGETSQLYVSLNQLLKEYQKNAENSDSSS